MKCNVTLSIVGFAFTCGALSKIFLYIALCPMPFKDFLVACTIFFSMFHCKEFLVINFIPNKLYTFYFIYNIIKS